MCVCKYMVCFVVVQSLVMHQERRNRTDDNDNKHWYSPFVFRLVPRPFSQLEPDQHKVTLANGIANVVAVRLGQQQI